MLCLAPRPVGAHAVLAQTVPASGVRLDRPPSEVSLRFDEAVETALGSLRVLDARGIDRARGEPYHPAGDTSRVAVRIGPLGTGHYIVAWRVVSADSHIVSGAYTFGVRADAGPVPSAFARPEGGELTVSLAMLRALLFGGILTATGLRREWIVTFKWI